MKPLDLMWGLKDVEFDAPAIWGARAILTLETEQLKTESKYHDVVELLWDRQELRADDGVSREDLKLALNGRTGKPGAIVKFIKLAYNSKLNFYTAEPQKVVVGNVEFYFSTKDSHGYLYITARLAPNQAACRTLICGICGKSKPREESGEHMCNECFAKSK